MLARTVVLFYFIKLISMFGVFREQNKLNSFEKKEEEAPHTTITDCPVDSLSRGPENTNANNPTPTPALPCSALLCHCTHFLKSRDALVPPNPKELLIA
jgi:hypothetical protein